MTLCARSTWWKSLLQLLDEGNHVVVLEGRVRRQHPRHAFSDDEGGQGRELPLTGVCHLASQIEQLAGEGGVEVWRLDWGAMP